jgi:hypothetical protein
MDIDFKSEVDLLCRYLSDHLLGSKFDDNCEGCHRRTFMRDMHVSSVNVPSAASMSAQVSARSNRVAGDTYAVPAGSDRDTLSLKNQSKFKTPVEMKAEKKPIEAAPTQSTTEVFFNEARVDALNKELVADGNIATAYASHGNKGTYVDFSA